MPNRNRRSETAVDASCQLPDQQDHGSRADLLILLAFWGECGGVCLGDLDGDGSVSTSDLLILLANWG